MTNEEYAVRITEIKHRLYKTALLYLGNESAAVDVLDEAVYKGLRSIKKLKNDEFFKTWITRILINECHNIYKHNKRFLLAEELPETAAEEFDNLPLKEAISKLPKDLKEVIILRFFWGCTLDETSNILQMPVGTVSTKQRKALDLLRLDLGKEEEV